MPSKTRWALNPKKWFGIKSNATKNSKVPSLTAATRIIPRICSEKNQIQVLPISISNEMNKTNTNITQLQLPAFSVRREKTLSTYYRQNTFHPIHTEPTIRKTSRREDDLLIDTTRWNIQSLPASIYETSKYENSSIKQFDPSLSNMSHRCVIDYPKHLPNRIEECSLPTRSSSSSSINDENDNSSSSGIFTDERQCTESKDILEVLSIESIADSQTSLNHSQTRPIIHHYRRPMSVFETNDDKSPHRQDSLRRSHRSHSAEGILKDTQTLSISKSRQSSAAIIKKIEKRYPKSQSPPPPVTLEKAGLVRITNDTYRLTANQINHFTYLRKNSIHSLIPNFNSDDPLRSANNEESYATVPHTSSTEQINNNHIQNDLRILVDECIRPMVGSIGKNRSIKYPHRHKRSHAHTQLNINNITEKLLSSIDDSIYTRYQRCN